MDFESKFFKDGWDAFKKGTPTTACPHEEESWSARQWRAGWAKAQHEYTDEEGLSRA